MAEARRGLLARLGLGRDRTAAQPWQEADAAVTVADAAGAARLAQEAATPFGYRRPAGELLAAFGGTGEEERRRATAALALAGIAADPPLADAAPTQYVQLRRIEAAAPRRPAAAAPAAPEPHAGEPAPPAPEPAPPAPEPAPPAPEPAPPAAAPRSPTDRVAARFAPTAPVTRDRRIAAGLLGLAALAVVMVVAVAMRSFGGDDETAASALPPATETTTAPTRTTAPPAARAQPTETAPGRASAGAPTDTAPADPGDAASSPAATTPVAPARPRAVRLRVVPSEPSYVCIADGGGETIWEGMLTGPYEVRRARLVIRVGVATARITANGRPVRVTTAPGAFELTPREIRELPGDQHVCGAATTAPPPDAAAQATTAG